MSKLCKLFFFIAGFLIGFGLLAWLGLQVRPKSFPSFTKQSLPLKTMPLPDGLPLPVERYYKIIYGDEIPVIETVVILGRGTLKPFIIIPIPARYVFVHISGKDYRHYFEATLFGIPLLKINEGYVDGVSFFESPMAKYTDDPNSNQGANLTLWAEAIWFPSVWLTDSRTHWEPVDENTALLYVPFEDGEENFLVRFNPNTGLIDAMESMRFREIGENQPKILWILSNEIKQPTDQNKVISVGSAMWLDQGSPWAYFAVEELSFNVDVNTYILQSGY